MDSQCDRSHIGRINLEELLARIGLKPLHDFLAAVRPGIHLQLGEDSIHPGAQDRNLAHGLDVCRGRVDSQEATFPGDSTLIVEALDPDVVKIGGTMHRRSTVGRGEHQDAGLMSLT